MMPVNNSIQLTENDPFYSWYQLNDILLKRITQFLKVYTFMMEDLIIYLSHYYDYDYD